MSNKSNQFNMSYLTNISEDSCFTNVKYTITTPYDEFISSNINFELFAILEFIINSYMPFGVIFTKRPLFHSMFTGDMFLYLLIPQSNVTKKLSSIYYYTFMDERKYIKTYGVLGFSSSFELLADWVILSYLPKFKTIKELYLKTKLSGKPIPYRMDKIIKHFKEESNKVIEDYDAPF
jgi:hypothetical protein